MGRLSRVTSALISLAVSVLSILFLYGYLSPLGLSPTAILGSSFSQALGGQYLSSGSTNSTGYPAGAILPTTLMGGSYAALLPGGAIGLVAFTVLSRMGSITRAATSPSMPNANEMMKRFNIPGMMPGMGMGGQSMPDNLPADMTKTQFIVLRSFRQGLKNSKEIGKSLGMDHKEVDQQATVLKTNGYLTGNNKVTAKAMELLGG